ncbi:SWIM zinc finger family protein [Streptomyces fractus]|uniref:SWIM zinc finger family protein n=1 Tax=Streptomyces fractus TaxID=641806 RepID=UPI003CF47139
MSGRTRAGTLVVLPATGSLCGRRELADQWWGRSWTDSLEDPDGQRVGYADGFSSSGRDGRLSRARTLARKGAVGEIAVRAGSLTGRVKGSQRSPYRCEIRVPELPDAMWESLLDAWAAAGPELLAELSDGRICDLAIDTAIDAEVLLTPTPDEYVHHCSCPDWGDPCKHAAALSYAFAHALDARHDALLALRGRPLERVCADLTTRISQRVQEQALSDEAAARTARPVGVPAGPVFARARKAKTGPARLPNLPSPVKAPADIPTLTVPFTIGESPDPAPLHLLAADTAHRAATLYTHLVAPVGETGTTDEAAATTAPAPGLWLDADPWHDTVRRAADSDPHQFGRLLNSSDTARTNLARAALAWRHGGPSALPAMDGTHVPDREAETAARHQLLRALAGRSAPPRIRRTRGRLHINGEDVELRWGPDGRWYPYRKDRGQWWAAGPPARDAAEALRGALTTD